MLFLVTCERYLEVPAVNGIIDYPEKVILQALLTARRNSASIVRIEGETQLLRHLKKMRDAPHPLSVPHFSDGLKPAAANLFDFDFCAGRFDLLLDVFGLLLGDTFLHRLRRAFDERFGFS